MSAMMPSASGMPHSTPALDSAASSSPDSTRMGTPGMRACRLATNSGPLEASRTAAVASTSNGSAPMARAMAW